MIHRGDRGDIRGESGGISRENHGGSPGSGQPGGSMRNPRKGCSVGDWGASMGFPRLMLRCRLQAPRLGSRAAPGAAGTGRGRPQGPNGAGAAPHPPLRAEGRGAGGQGPGKRGRGGHPGRPERRGRTRACATPPPGAGPARAGPRPRCHSASTGGSGRCPRGRAGRGAASGERGTGTGAAGHCPRGAGTLGKHGGGSGDDGEHPAWPWKAGTPRWGPALTRNSPPGTGSGIRGHTSWVILRESALAEGTTGGDGGHPIGDWLDTVGAADDGEHPDGERGDGVMLRGTAVTEGHAGRDGEYRQQL